MSEDCDCIPTRSRPPLRGVMVPRQGPFQAGGKWYQRCPHGSKIIDSKKPKLVSATNTHCCTGCGRSTARASTVFGRWCDHCDSLIYMNDLAVSAAIKNVIHGRLSERTQT